MSNWELESNSTTQTFVSIIGLLVGSFFIMVGKNFRTSDSNDLLAGFILGILIFFISLITLLLDSKKFIVVDSKSKNILFRVKNRVGEKNLSIPFGSIESLSISEFGTKDNGSISYDIEIKLKKGKPINFFGGGFFDGQYNKSEVERMKNRLSEYIGLKN